MKKTPAAAASTPTGQSLQAALAAVQLIPSEVPLSVRPATDADSFTPGDPAVVATFVGGVSADLVVIVDESIDQALQGASGAAGATVSVADALRPALEAAAATLGQGVLSDVRSGDGAEVAILAADETEVFALEAAGTVHGWFGVKVRPGSPSTSASASAARSAKASGGATMRMLYDVEMTLTAEIGRAKLPVRQVLDLTPGTIIELDRVAGSPADLMVNGRLIARGEVVVIDEDYGLRVTEIVEQGENA